LRNSIEKHFGAVNCLRVLSDPSSGTAGSKQNLESPAFVSAGRDAMLNFWSLSGDCISSQAAHRGYVSYLSDVLSYPNGNRPTSANYAAPWLLSAGSDSSIKLWDLRRCRCVADITGTASVPVGSGNISKIVWCPSGRKGNAFVTASSSGQIRLIEKTPTLIDSDLPVNGGSLTKAEWMAVELPSHTHACTDLVSSDTSISCSSKSGRIFRWNIPQ
jgi:WD40 repeat protein